ncbi:MAG TPA: ABC transporter substrate-binding protein [Vicinamibacterales bacterium]
MLRPFVFLTLAALSLTACGDEPPDPAPAPTSENALAIGYSDPTPRGSAAALTSLVSALADERLVQLRRDGRPEPALAERWEVSPDGLTWRFFLKEGLTLHDGSPLTASEARRSIDALLKASRAEQLPGIRDVAQVEAAGPLELRVRLQRPNWLFIEDVAVSAITGGESGESQAGPFRLVSRTATEAVLAGFPGYHRGTPGLDQIRIRAYPTPRSAWGAMMRGEIDFLYDVAPEAIGFVEQSKTTVVATFLRPYVTGMVFNMNHPVLQRRDVRVALNAGVNRSAVLNTALQNRGYPATDHVWPRHWARDPMGPRFRHDPARAARMLDEAGLPLRPARKEGERAGRFAFTCLVPIGDPRFERVGLIVQRQLIELGVDMRLEALPLPDLAERLAAGKFDAFLFELLSGHGLDFTHWFWRSPGPPIMKTGYRAADAVLDRITKAGTDQAMREAVADLQRVMHEDPPGIFLYWSETTRAVSRRFNLPREPDRDILSTVARWRVADPSGTE